METTNSPVPLPSTTSYDPTGTYTPSPTSTEGPIPAPTYTYPSETTSYTAPAPAPTLAPEPAPEPVGGPPPDYSAITADPFMDISGMIWSPSDVSADLGVPADLGGPAARSVPADLGAPEASPSLTALQGLLGRSGGGAPPGLQSLLEGTASRLGGQARQRYGRQFQTVLANQRLAASQRGGDTPGLETAVGQLQQQLQTQQALDRLRGLIGQQSPHAARARASQMPSSARLGSLASSPTSPYLY